MNISFTNYTLVYGPGLNDTLHNGTISNSTVPQISDSPLTWQSGFWALLAIALGSMTQVSPSADFPLTDPFSMTRASPIICLADSVVIIVWTLGLSVFSDARLSVIEALRCFRKETGLEKKNERVTILTMTLFLLGPLPQFIKLNACSGIPWTLVWAWTFMVCYLLYFVSIIFGRNEHNFRLIRAGTGITSKKLKSLQNFTTVIYVFAYLAQASLLLWLFGRLLYVESIHRVINLIWSVIISIIMYALSICFGGLCIFGSLHAIWANPYITPIALMGVGFGGFYVVGAILGMRSVGFLSFTPAVFSGWSGLLWVIWFVLIIVVVLMLSVFIFGWTGLEITMDWIGRKPVSDSNNDEETGTQEASTADLLSTDRASAAGQILFAILMLLFALCSYWRDYNPDMTFKPGWVDVFG
jgi:hypothetical protein